MTDLSNLLAECEAQGIRLLLAGDDSLTIDAPHEALTPDLLERMQIHKGELLRTLLNDATAVWQSTLDRLEGDPHFPPDVMEALRAADVRFVPDDPHLDLTPEQHKKPKRCTGQKSQHRL